MGIMIDGKLNATNSPRSELTESQYNDLSSSQKNNGTTYFITDANDSTYQKIQHLKNIIGNIDDLSAYGDGTIIGALQELVDRMGGFTFSLDANESYVIGTCDDSQPTPATIDPPASDSDDDVADHLIELVGSTTALANCGYSTVVGAILDLFDRIQDFSFSHNSKLGVLTLEYDEIVE